MPYTTVLELAAATLLLVLVGGCRNSEMTARPATASPGNRSQPSAVVVTPLDDVTEEFHRFRLRRQLVPPNRWDDDLNSWGGRMHVVMDQLLARVGVPGTPRARVIAVMGDPDEVAGPGAEQWPFRPHPIDSSEGAPRVLIYYWRGLHDFLFFLVRDDRVVRADWWMAGE